MKKFLICLSLLFSLLFIGNVKAYQYYNVDLNEEFFNNGWEVLEGKSMKSITGSGTTKILHKDDFSYSICSTILNANSDIEIKCMFLTDISFKNKDGDAIYYNSNTRSLYTYAPAFQYNINNKTYSATFDFGTWFYDYYPVSFDLYDSNNNQVVTKKFDYPPINNYPHTFNFHLNEGHVYDDRAGFEFENWDDFSFTLYDNEIEDFFTNLKVEKATMIFEGWYYDANFNNPFNITDNITSDVDLYAKFRYEKVDDFLNNTNFTEYTFDTLYNYAIITKGNNSGDIYLGLNINKYDITVYEYKENLSNYDNERGFCLVPIYSKNGTYYYLLDTTKTLDTEVLVLPKTTFENNDYKFLLTDNAHVTYTNNLEETTIYDSNGNQINTNLEETYQKFQDSMISEENDLLTIFKNLTGLKDNNIFNNINSLWNKFKGTPIYNYLMILIVGSLIILIIKAAKRK